MHACAQASIPAGVCAVRGPAARGLLALGTLGGGVLLADPRAGYKVEHSLAAHASGLADLDARSELLATCGYGSRQGAVVPDPYVKVYDLRMGARMASSLGFNPGPALLRLHPKFSSTLLLASLGGTFTLADTGAAAGFQRYQQLEADGDQISSLDVSSSGETVLFGSAAGYLHAWALSGQQPCVNQGSSVLETAPRKQPPAVPLAEDDCFALAAVYPPPAGARLLSDWPERELRAPHLPPRLVHPAVAKGLRQVDFVGHAANPHHRRGLPPGEAAAAAAPLRALRLEPRADESLQLYAFSLRFSCFFS
jgi:PAB-dependent poly(A)-specific ribonuclease subunit 2